MAIQLRQQLKLSQQLIMTPQLQMAIKLLQLSKQELLEMVSQELEENPALEGEVEEPSAEETLMEQTEALPEDPSPDREVTIEENIQEDIDWSSYFQDTAASGRVSQETETRETSSIDSFTAQKESLNDHLLWQLLMTALSPEEETIGSLIIGNLNPDGYLETTVEELAELSGATPERVETALSIIQDFDPIG
ncbi:MAG: RNA polymerase sigma-54 factor, partial [Desulfobacterales bacterium]